MFQNEVLPIDEFYYCYECRSSNVIQSDEGSYKCLDCGNEIIFLD